MAKKNEEKIYEYFKMDEFTVTGRFKDYVDRLWVQNKISESYIKRLVDIYAIAAVIGLKAGRCLPDEPGEEKRTIQLKQISDNIQTLKPIMQLILMLDTTRGLSEEERLDSAFRNPENETVYRQNMNLFNSYARGGIEYLYDHLVTRDRDDETDEFEDPRINNILALMRLNIEETL